MAHLEYISNIKDEFVEKMKNIRIDFQILHGQVEALGKSRELSIALTEIENALMWTIKHLAIEGKQ